MHDLIILGGGPAGYHAAEKAGKAGLNTILIEKSSLGGVCLNEGCIPSKAILHSSNLFWQAKNSKAFGVSAEKSSLDIATIMKRKQKIIETLRKGIAFTLKKSNVTVKNGSGFILPCENAKFRVHVADTIIEGKNLLICTGSEAIKLPISGADQEFVFTNREILEVTSLPDKLTIVGGGAIGLEIATFFAEAGSKVTVIELLPDIATPVDREISVILKKEMMKKGVAFYLESKVISLGDHTVTFENKEKTETIKADIALFSVGRRPITREIGLENINAACKNGAIVTDEYGRTSIPSVYAAGDVNGKSMLAHTAYREADVCINTILGKNETINYNAIPAVIYTHPEVATVGLTKESAEELGYDPVVSKLPMSYNSRYLVETNGERGMCKAVVDRKSRTLLGVHMVGAACSEMIFGAAHMINCKSTIDEIKNTVFPHPSVSEIVKDTILSEVNSL